MKKVSPSFTFLKQPRCDPLSNTAEKISNPSISPFDFRLILWGLEKRRCVVCVSGVTVQTKFHPDESLPTLTDDDAFSVNVFLSGQTVNWLNTKSLDKVFLVCLSYQDWYSSLLALETLTVLIRNRELTEAMFNKL